MVAESLRGRGRGPCARGDKAGLALTSEAWKDLLQVRLQNPGLCWPQQPGLPASQFRARRLRQVLTLLVGPVSLHGEGHLSMDSVLQVRGQGAGAHGCLVPLSKVQIGYVLRSPSPIAKL